MKAIDSTKKTQFIQIINTSYQTNTSQIQSIMNSNAITKAQKVI